MNTVFVIVNVFVGIGLLSKPYALAQGGWISLLFLTLVCVWTYNTACMLTYSMHRMMSSSYDDLSQKLFGHKWLVTMGVLLESGSAILVILLFIWKNVDLLLDTTFDETVAICFVFTLPSCFHVTLKNMKWVSFIGVISNVAIIGTILFVSFTRPTQQTKMFDSVEQMSMSTGIYIVALGGHTALPQIFDGDYEKMKRYLRISFFVIWVLYLITAIAGYLSFGNDVQVLVTEDLKNYPGGILFYVILVFVCMKSYTSFIAIFNVFVEIPLYYTSYKKCGRFVMLVSLSSLAYILRDYLNYVETFAGSICIMFTSIILPTIMYAKLQEGPLFTLPLLNSDIEIPKKSYKTRILIGIGVITCIVLVGLDIKQLYEK